MCPLPDWMNGMHLCHVSLALHKQALSCTMQTYAFTKTWLASVAIKPLLCIWTHIFFFSNNQWSSQDFLGAFLVSLGPLCSVWDLELCWYSSAEFYEWKEVKVCELNVNPFLRLHSPLFFCSFIYSFIQSVGGPCFSIGRSDILWKKESEKIRYFYTHFQLTPCYKCK